VESEFRMCPQIHIDSLSSKIQNSGSPLIPDTSCLGQVVKFHGDFIPSGIIGFVFDFISLVVFWFGFLFAMGYSPNPGVGP